MTEQHEPSVAPGYGGEEEVGPGDHNAAEVDPGYGGEHSFDHTPDGPAVAPGYGGDRSEGFIEREHRQEGLNEAEQEALGNTAEATEEDKA